MKAILALGCIFVYWINCICWLFRLTRYRSYDSIYEYTKGRDTNMSKKKLKTLEDKLPWKTRKLLAVNEYLRLLRKTNRTSEVMVVDFENKKLLSKYKGDIE